MMYLSQCHRKNNFIVNLSDLVCAKRQDLNPIIKSPVPKDGNVLLKKDFVCVYLFKVTRTMFQDSLILLFD